MSENLRADRYRNEREEGREEGRQTDTQTQRETEGEREGLAREGRIVGY